MKLTRILTLLIPIVIMLTGFVATTSLAVDVNKIRWAAEQGNASAQYKLGVMYYNGQGVSQDYQEAVKWWRLAAEQGNSDAQRNLGVLYADGQGVPQSYQEAAKWYRKAAEQGNVDAQNALRWIAGKEAAERAEQERARQTEEARQAEYQHQTQLAAKRAEKARRAEAARQAEYLRQTRLAAEQGDAAAQNDLGVMYYNGQGVPQDYKEAVNWYRLAAEQGNEYAQANLGSMYANGWGVPENYVEGYAWTIVAVANGRDEAATNKQWFQERMNTMQIAAAQQRAQEIQAGLERKRQLAQTPVDQVPASDIAPSGSGSGLLIEGGYVVTCWHVVKNAKNIVVRSRQQDYVATVAGSDADSDLAVLQLAGMSGGASLHIAAETKLGEKVFTLGFPHPELQGDEVKYTDGSVSSLNGPQNSPLYYQISVPLQSGNSGGPLFDGHGNLVGIVAAKLDAIKALVALGDLPQNVNYAIKAQYLLPTLKSIPGFPSHSLNAKSTGSGGLSSLWPTEPDWPKLAEQLKPFVVLVKVY